MGFRGNGAAVVIGTVIALYDAFGVAQALQNAMNVIWSIPRHRRPNPVKTPLRSLLLTGIAGLAVLVTTVIPRSGGVPEPAMCSAGVACPARHDSGRRCELRCVHHRVPDFAGLRAEHARRRAVAAAVNLTDAARVRNRLRVEHREGLERHLRSVCTRSGSDGRACSRPPSESS